MQVKTLSIITGALLLASSGCHVKSTTTDVSPGYSRAPTCASAVTVFDSRSDVPASYYELAWIDVEGNSVWTTDAQMRSKMQDKAAEVGANGLIANPVRENKTGVNVLGEAVGAHTATSRASGLAIWMPAERTRAMNACPTR
jgi:hypothetical protein